MVPFLPDYAVTQGSGKIPEEKGKINYAFLILRLLATFLFQAANMGIYVYIIGQGENAGLDRPFISDNFGGRCLYRNCRFGISYHYFDKIGPSAASGGCNRIYYPRDLDSPLQ